MRKTTVAPKKPTNAKLRASTSPTTGDEATLSPIKEEDIQLPEVQGSSNTTSLTIDMEPLSDQQKEFFKSYLDDTRTHMEEERREIDVGRKEIL